MNIRTRVQEFLESRAALVTGGIFLVLSFSFLFFVLLQGANVASVHNSYPELSYLEENRELDFRDLSNYFTEIAEEEGARYAFEVMKAAPLPGGIDLHLLGHVVGDILYRQEGLDGIEICTHDFRNACSHAIVVGLFIEEGEAALPQIAEACRKAPGGKGAYTMCFHGLGHGVLAFTEYDMQEAVQLCRRAGSEAYQHREYDECVGGVVMEMMAGTNDREAWEKQKSNYFLAEDPRAPCSLDFIDDEVEAMCYTYLTPHLFEYVGANLSSPQPEHFKEAFKICDTIERNESREACYASFGKEFIVLAGNRDIRQASIESMTSEQLAKVYMWCSLAPNEAAVTTCTLSASSSLYWGGENNRDVAIRFCNAVSAQEDKSVCFQNLIGAVNYYIDDTSYRSAFCQELPESYRQECEAVL